MVESYILHLWQNIFTEWLTFEVQLLNLCLTNTEGAINSLRGQRTSWYVKQLNGAASCFVHWKGTKSNSSLHYNVFYLPYGNPPGQQVFSILSAAISALHHICTFGRAPLKGLKVLSIGPSIRDLSSAFLWGPSGGSCPPPEFIGASHTSKNRLPVILITHTSSLQGDSIASSHPSFLYTSLSCLGSQ